MSARIHSCGAACGHRDHRSTGRDFDAYAAESPRELCEERDNIAHPSDDDQSRELRRISDCRLLSTELDGRHV